MATATLRELINDAASPACLVPALCSGLVLGVLGVVIELSLASLIFSGPLARFAPSAAGLCLFGAAVMCLAVGLTSGFRAAICLPQDAPAAVMAAVAAGVAASLAPGGQMEHAPVTVAAAMALSSAATGLMFLAMGRFGLGNLMRYVPYPVVGGFMAGIGWLLVQGGVSIVIGASLTLHDLPMLLTEDRLLRLLPAVLLTAGLLFALNKWNSVFVLPGALAAAVALFFAYLAATGRGLTDAKLAGFLLGSMPEGGALWPPFSPAQLANVNWAALAPQVPQLLTIPLISTISLLLTASGLETATRTDQDLGRELSANGLANLLGAFTGCQAGYTALSLSLLGPKTGAVSRLSALFAALLMAAATFCGAGVLGYFPRFILGGMVLFLGVATLIDWLGGARKSVTRVEYALILAILFAIGMFGFLSGVAFGVVAASVIFVVKYSRLPVLKLDTDATQAASARQRSVPDRHILRQRGTGVRVLRVTGYLFFGSANALSNAAAMRLKPEQGPPPSHLIMDFAEADGFDSSAVNSFLRLLQRCAAVGCTPVLAAPPPGLEEQMRRASPEDADRALFLPDLDRALERCEDELLAAEAARHAAEAADRDKLFDLAVDDLLLQLEEGERFEALLERLDAFLPGGLPRRAAATGEVICRAGADPGGVWLLVSGHVEETSPEAAGPSHQANQANQTSRLRTLGPGAVFGSAGGGAGGAGEFTAVEDCRLAFMPASALRELEAGDPATALAFYALFSAQLEGRLAEAQRPRV